VTTRLRRRRDFLKAQKGRRANSGLFSVQAVANTDGGPRVGFTVSKKVDARAVKRNRIRRRLKEAARLERGAFGVAPVDFVFVARPGALKADFGGIRREMRRTVAKLLELSGSGEDKGARSGRGD
jgi:ribonuclease P protein component